MGYDMSVRGAPADTEHDYLRRNIFAGYPFGLAMIELGMGFDAGNPPEWPEESAYGVEYKEWQDAEGKWQGGYVGDRAAEYEQAMTDVRDWHGPVDKNGVPCHKIWGSNDGWHVTKKECEQALDAYRAAIAAGKTHPGIFGDDAIPFLECAAKFDGFETH